MVITSLTKDSFKIQTKDLTILIDPINYRHFKNVDLIINTLKPSLIKKPEEENFLWLENQGEYEIKGCQIRGFKAGEKNNQEMTVYLLKLEEINIGIFGFYEKSLPENLKDYFLNLEVALGRSDGETAPVFWVTSEVKEKEKNNVEYLEKFNLKKKDIVYGKKTKIICLKN